MPSFAGGRALKFIAILVGVIATWYAMTFEGAYLAPDSAPSAPASSAATVSSEPRVAATDSPGVVREGAVDAAPPAAAPAEPNASPASPAVIARFRIRLVREDRTPLANANVRLGREEHGGSGTLSVASKVDTDADGYVTFEAAAIDPDKTRAVEASHPADDVERTGKLDFSRSFSAGDNDLGELVLVELPVIASGRVIDHVGAPVAAATIELQWENDGIFRRSPTPRFEPTRLTTTSREDGTFALRGEQSGQLGLVARKTGVGESPLQPIVLRQAGVELCLLAMGAIAGSVRIPENFAADQLTVVRFDPGVFDFGGGSGDSRPLAPDGSFRFDELGAGSYGVRLEGTHPDPLVVVNDVIVRSGETTRDPRLQDVRLDPAVGILAVEIVDASGAFLDAQVMVRARTREHSVGATRLDHGRWRVVTHPSGQDLVVNLAGYVPRWIPDVRVAGEPLRVELSTCPSLRIGVGGAFPLVRDEQRFAITLTPSAELRESIPDPLENYVTCTAVVGDDRCAMIHVPFPGRYRVDFAARKQFGSFTMDQGLAGETWLDVAGDAFAETSIEASTEARAYFERR